MSQVENPTPPPAPDAGEIKKLIEQMLSTYTNHPHSHYIQKSFHRLLEMLGEDVTSAEWRLMSTVVSEIQESFRLFSGYRTKRKVTVFGSARPKPESEEFKAAVEFGKVITKLGYMVITGGGPGIMHAANLGAGRDQSFGLNIEIPWEQKANPVVEDDLKLITYHYFFTRKLFLVKENHALALFPGGYGTQDEAFETLVLIQAGKAPIRPIVMIDLPHLNYWTKWLRFMQTTQLKNGYINKEDLCLWNITYDVNDAARIITEFYRNFHSQHFLGHTLLLRIQRQLNAEEMTELNQDFSDILTGGSIEQSGALKEERERDGSIAVPELPRLVFDFNMSSYGRLRQMIDRINSFR